MSRRLRVLVVTVLTALLGTSLATVTASQAQAEERTVSGGRLDWGIKSSFQSYITGPIAQGEWTLLDGAATGFRFHSAAGSYDPATGALTADFTGGVRFVGHKENGEYRLDMTLRAFSVQARGGTGTLYADVASKDRSTGQMSSRSQVGLATLDLGGVDMRGGGSPVALSGVPATLTAEGERAFAGYYPAGTELDPVSLSVDVGAAAAKSPRPSATAGDKEKKKPGDADGGEIQDGAVDWGVRRTFRDYVTGPVAKGGWELDDGAQDGGALFRFAGGEGTYDRRKASVDASFTGTLHFTGEDLDLELGRVTVSVADGRGTLAADVTTEGETAKGVSLVTFPADGLEPEDGLVAVTGAPAKLTGDGAEAFGGMYQEGTAMDPVSFAVALDAGAELPALPDLGSDPGPEPDKSADDEPSPLAAEPADDSSPAVPLAVGGAGVLLAAVAAYAWFAVRRRRAGATAGTETTTET